MSTKDDIWANDGQLVAGDLRLRMEAEEELSIFDPRENNTNLGAMICSHRRYDLGDKESWAKEYRLAIEGIFDEREGSLAEVVDWIKGTYGATVVLPLYLIDHSGLAMRAGRSFADVDPGEWDSGLVGFIFDTPKGRSECGTPPELIEECLRGEVSEYDSWLGGDVWGYVIERKVICSHGDEHWDHVDSCGGFIGYEWAAQAAAMAWDIAIAED